MAEVIRMPLLSDTMKEGVIAQWNVKVGDKVKADDVIADVETDKATMEVNPYVDGTVLYIAGDKGVAIPANGIMAMVGDEGKNISNLLTEQAPNTPTENILLKQHHKLKLLQLVQQWRFQVMLLSSECLY